MSWTDNARHQYNKRKLHYSSDCRDGEWQVIQPFLARSSKVGRPRKHDDRDI